MAFGYTDIKAWSDLTGIEVEPWELKILMSMTGTYSNGTIKYRSKRYDLHPPHKPKDISKQVDKRLAKLFGD